MTDDELKAALPAGVYDALMAKIEAPKPVGPAPQWMLWAKGAVKSYTNWFGALLIAWPTIQPQVQPSLEYVLGKGATSHLIQAVGAIVILLRVKTTKALKEKA